MELISECPFPVTFFKWRLKGLWMTTVVCKATFTLRRGSSPLAGNQEPIARADAFFDGNPKASLRIPCDLAPFKPRIDVAAVGYAYAPPGQPVEELTARLQIGELDKSVIVRGAPRDEGRASLSKMSLRYERGAKSAGNPVGVEDADAANLISVEDAVLPAGFGPISPTWGQRSQFVQGLPDWSIEDLEDEELPEGIDPQYFNVAPRDQQLTSLDEDAELRLHHLHPVHTEIVTRLEVMRPKVTESRMGGRPKALFMRCDTLWIDSDRGICTLTWRGQTSLDKPDMDLIISASGAPPSSVGERTGALPHSSNNPKLAMGTVVADGVLGGAAPLPFKKSPGSSKPSPESAPVEPPVHYGPAPAPVHKMPEPSSPSSEDVSPWAAHARDDVDVRPSLRTPDGAIARPRPLNEDFDSPNGVAEPRPLPRSDGTVQLVWFTPDVMPRLRRRWDDLLDVLDDYEGDPDLDAYARSGSAEDVEDHREVFQVLVSGDQVSVQGLESLLGASVRDDGKLVPPLVLVEGDLEMSLDALARLEKAVAIADALCGAEGNARAKVEAAKGLLQGGALDGQMAVVEELYRGIGSAFAKDARSLPNRYLEQQVERVLHNSRAYDRRSLFGSEQLRGQLKPVGGRTAVPVYIPAACEALLPLFASFRARLLAELHPRQDQGEAHPVALRVCGVGHLVSLRRG